MSTPFSLYLERDSSLHQLNPLTKLVLTGFCLVSGLALPGIWLSYVAYLFFFVPLAAVGRILQPFLRASLRTVLPFAISLFLIQGFLWTGGTPIFTLGPISLKLEGVYFAIRMTGRILVVVSSFLLLAFATRPDDLMQSVDERGAPKNLSYLILTTLQIVPQFVTKANKILDAQRSRGLETEGSFWQRARALMPLVQPLILGSIIDIEQRAIALEVRAFGRKEKKTHLRVLSDSKAQVVARWLLLLGMVLVVLARVIFWWLL